MENSMEDYKKISDSVKSYSDIELDLIKRGLVDFSKEFLFYKYFLEEFGMILDLIEKIDGEMNKREDATYEEICRDMFWWMVVWRAILDHWWSLIQIDGIISMNGLGW